MKKLLYILIISFSATFQVFSQKILISEIYNLTASANGEWTELITCQDHVDLRGFVLRDITNSGTWYGAIKFNNIPFWSDIRIGTIIIINHRISTLIDTNPDDGFLELSAQNIDYFEQVLYSESGNWSIGALNINQDNDFIQIIDQSGNNHILLGHSKSKSSAPYLVYDSIPNPKMLNIASIPDSSSIKVIPGSNINEYIQLVDETDSYTQISTNTSKGLPNNKTTNSKFWRNLRQPNWFTPNASISKVGNKVEVSWTILENSNNDYEGYLVVRIPKLSLNLAEYPVDGKVYSIGNFLGSAEVIGFVKGFSNNIFSDETFKNLNCGIEYLYRIYACRYSQDEQGMDNDPVNARGISYNEDNFAESKTVSKTIPVKPKIISPNNKLEFCEGETVILSLSEIYSTDFTIQWYKDSNKINGQNSPTLTVTQSGQYYVEITNNESQCKTLADAKFIRIYQTSSASLFIIVQGEKKPILKDTVIYVCEDEDPNYNYPRLRLESNDSVFWYFDDRLKTEELNKTEIIAAQKGTFYGVSKIGICTDTTPRVSIIYFDFQVDFNPDPLFFDADDYPIKDLAIINHSNVDLNILESDFIIPPNFEFNNVIFPIFIKREDSAIVSIKYTQTNYTSDNGKFRLLLLCSRTFSLDFNGIKKLPGISKVISVPDTIDFGIIPICELNSPSKKLYLKSVGTIASQLYSPILDDDIELDNISFPKILNADSTIEINVNFRGSQSGEYFGEILFPYISEDKNKVKDTLHVFWKIEIVQPNLEFDQDVFVKVPTCSDSTFIEITVFNPTKTPIIINNDFNNSSIISIQNLPITVKSEDSSTVSILVISDKDITISDNFSYQPCDNTKTINFNITKSNIQVSEKDKTINLGVLPLCSETDWNLNTGEILVSGGDVVIKNIDITGDLQTDLEINQIISANTKFKLKYIGNEIGAISGKIIVTFTPCDYTLEYDILGEVDELKISIQPNQKIDFDTCIVGKTYSKSVDIQNQSAFPVTINFTSTNSKFSLNTINQSPIIIDGNSSKTIIFDFLGDVENVEETCEFNLLVYPCDLNYSVDMTAYTMTNKVVGNLRIQLPDSIEGKIGEIVNLPVKIIPEGFDFSDLIIDQLSIDFTYDGFQIYPKNLIIFNKSKLPENSTFSLIEENINNSSVNFNFPDSYLDFGNNDLDFSIDILILQSQKRNSIFKIDTSFMISDGLIKIESDSTKIKILDNCLLQDKGISFDNSSLIPSIIQTGDNLHIELTTIVDGNINLNVVDVNGEILQNKTFTDVKHGTYETNIDLSNMPPGVYFIEIQTSSGKFIQKIIIIR